MLYTLHILPLSAGILAAVRSGILTAFLAAFLAILAVTLALRALSHVNVLIHVPR